MQPATLHPQHLNIWELLVANDVVRVSTRYCTERNTHKATRDMAPNLCGCRRHGDPECGLNGVINPIEVANPLAKSS